MRWGRSVDIERTGAESGSGMEEMAPTGAVETSSAILHLDTAAEVSFSRVEPEE